MAIMNEKQICIEIFYTFQNVFPRSYGRSILQS